MIVENFQKLHHQIRKAERSAAREEGAVRLIAVSKMQTQESLHEALSTGHRLFGENKVQEAMAHWVDLKKIHPDLRVHLIGPLQTNKVEEAVALFDCIHTLDREKLALALSKEMQGQGRKVPCLIQVNTGEEPQKAGISPLDVPHFLKFCVQDCGLDVRGLMCIPPVDEPPALHFALLKKLAEENALLELSMGMSADFEKAIALGATYVRVGTALFGSRAV